MKQTAAWDLVVVGGAYTDYVVQGLKISEQGETTLGSKFLELPGSKVYYLSVSCLPRDMPKLPTSSAITVTR